jgi:hypothetical protein
MTPKVFLSTAIAAAALVFATSALADTSGDQRPPVDPLAVSLLRGQGYTQRQIETWTVGACSHEVKPTACFGPARGADLTDGAAKRDPLAESSLIGQGLSVNEARSWTVGDCSHRVRAASCYAMFEPTATASTPVVRSIGFDWGDAGIGAGATLGIVLLGGIGVGLASRHNRNRPTVRA